MNSEAYNTSFQILVEGNIAAGKSTFMDLLDKERIEVIEEPVEKWRNLNGINCYQRVVDNPEKYATTFQIYAQLTMLECHLKPPTKRFKILERSIFSSRYIFVEAQRSTKIITDMDYEIINSHFRWNVDLHNINVNTIIYLRADPEVCMERILQRSRKEEVTITLEYLQLLHKYHDNWLIDENFPIPADNVIVIDANKTPEDIFTATRDVFF